MPLTWYELHKKHPQSQHACIASGTLQLFGHEPHPYRPHYLGQVYPALIRLEKSGIIESEWGDEPSTPDRHRRRLYRLVDEESHPQDT